MTEQTFTIEQNSELCSGIYMMTIGAGQTLPDIRCGQFINVEIPSRQDTLLKRPFAIYDFDRGKGLISFCYKVVGKGTEHLSKAVAGQTLRAAYPLGNGFKIEQNHKRIILIGGGVGIFPLYSVFKTHPDRRYFSILGFKERCQVILKAEFEEKSKELLLCTEDGSLGETGFVTDSLKRNLDRIKPDLILSCGPKPMFKALKDALKDYPDIPVQISLEERMACGIGACLVCACAVREGGKSVNKRVCSDGPVFSLDEVEL